MVNGILEKHLQSPKGYRNSGPLKTDANLLRDGLYHRNDKLAKRSGSHE